MLMHKMSFGMTGVAAAIFLALGHSVPAQAQDLRGTGQVARAAAATASRDTAMDAARAGVDAAVKEAAQEAAKSAAKEAAKDAAKVAARDVSREAARTAVKVAQKEAAGATSGLVVTNGSLSDGAVSSRLRCSGSCAIDNIAPAAASSAQ